ncbi:3-isopropylmalate dehydrogenase [Elongatibacter sediminis]|uniref:3-isopropylmalate dehydrogenase n=1 Tax=Elongatibacter sediminis TaxID=3119006 RepID=A0AAW9RC79_9GAMM
MSNAAPADNHQHRIVAVPGDGVGPEVYASACTVLDVLSSRFGFGIDIDEQLIGGAAIDATGNPLPDETVAACRDAKAVLLGAVGGPKWDAQPRELRPERGLLRIRSELGLYCNLRPIVTHPTLHRFSPVRPERLDGVNVMIVRELTGGIYFGEKRREGDVAEDVCRYTADEITRVTRQAGRLAMQRDRRIVQVDKSNVIETSRLWREVTERVIGEEFPEVSLEHLYVDAAAMHLLSKPASFDVMLTENLFGDILSDEASMLCGSMGLLPSASLADGDFGLYEPVHGSAPDIAGQGIANPYAMLLSIAMMLRLSLHETEAADALDSAITDCWSDGVLTLDLVPEGVGTEAVTEAVCRRLTGAAAASRTA